MTDHEAMTYRPAIADQCRVGDRGWSAAAYRRRGIVATSDMDAYAHGGLSPDVAGMLHERAFGVFESVAVASVLSRAGIRQLLNQNRLVAVTGPAGLEQIAAASLPRARAWVHRTGAPVSSAIIMDQWGIRPSHVANWVAVDPLRRPADPYPILVAATVGRGVPREHLAGWLKFATAHHVLYFGQDRSDFFGGDTGLYARAGLSPAEAARMISNGTMNRDTLMLMAGLRV